jgi:hypothetical protein
MDISDVDVPLLAEQVRKIAEAEPLGRAQCRYFEDDGQPLCLVGHALALQGITLADVTHHGNGTYIGTVLDTVGDEHGVILDWLGAVQYKQDAGWRWEAAVKWADTEGNHAP